MWTASALRLAARLRREVGTATTVGLSFPKAGRSWVCFFLARYVAELTGGPIDLDVLAAGGVIPPVQFVHEHIDVFENVAAPARLLNEDLLMRRRILVLVRDPRDSLVSYWHQKRLREQRPVAERLERFADCPVYGIERISQGTALLLDLYERHRGDRLLVTYESLVAEPARQLPRILRFASNGRRVEERAERVALEASRFDAMRKWERGLTPDEARTRYDGRFGRRQAGVVDDGHFKVRRGQAGAFRAEMSPQLRRHVQGLPHTRALLERLAELRPQLARARHDQLQVPPAVAGA